MNKKISTSSLNIHRSFGTLPGKSSRSTFKAQIPLVFSSLLVFALLLSACSLSSAEQSGTPTQLPAASTANPTSTPVASGNSQSTAAPTSLDPCVLITSQEASALAGASFGAGLEDTTAGGGKKCVYGSNTSNVFTILVAQTADKAAAEAAKQDFVNMLQADLAKLTAEGFKITELPTFADGGITSQVTINTGSTPIYGSMFGFVKGTVFFGYSDLIVGSPSPTTDAMQALATVVLGRLS